MDFKLLSLLLYAAAFLYRLLLSFLDWRSKDNPVPENVRDVYDGEKYARWLKYHGETCALDLVETVTEFVIYFALLAFDVLPRLAPSGNVYLAAVEVLLFVLVLDAVAGAVFSYVGSMVIDEKYGFNKRTMKTFVIDQIRSFLISGVLTLGMVCLFILIYEALGDWTLLLFSGIMALFLLGLAALHPVFSKLFNKFTPMPDGELREKLTALLTANGYTVRQIQVMDGSRRDSRANAYFSGFGKMKTIVLYDTLLDTMTTDEIVAVFAHELGHGLHKDTLRSMPLSVLQVVVIVLAVWLTVRTGVLYPDFGFAGVNYGFAYVLVSIVELPLLTPLLSLMSNALTRRAEYRADAHAVKEGCGRDLVTALKKLSSDSLSDLAPSPLLVKLYYSHPTLSQRIAAIEKADTK